MDSEVREWRTSFAVGEGGQLIRSELACSLPLILWRSSKKRTESCSSGTDALAPMSKRIKTLLSPPLSGISGRESFKVPGRALPFSYTPPPSCKTAQPPKARTRGKARQAGGGVPPVPKTPTARKGSSKVVEALRTSMPMMVKDLTGPRK